MYNHGKGGAPPFTTRGTWHPKRASTALLGRTDPLFGIHLKRNPTMLENRTWGSNIPKAPNPGIVDAIALRPRGSN